MKTHYDVIVAGAGLAGNLAATMAARGGASVVLLDRNKQEEVGKKTNWGWVCGDAVAKSHIDMVTQYTGLHFKHPELDCHVEGVLAISPDMKYKHRFEGEGYALNRPLFETKLLDESLRSGVEYFSEFEVEGPLIENNAVVGIYGKDKQKQHKEIRAKIVIDCLGVATTVRRKLPHNPYVDREVDISDIEATGRYLYEFDLDHEDLNYYDPNNALIHLNQEVTPGGYGWVFPKSNGRTNIGIGVQKASLELRNKKMGKSDTLHSLMDQYVKSIPIFKNLRQFSEGSNGGKGYWSVAVRRQMDSLVFNGYMGAGDSMAMPNPISAGGIGPALVAGLLAGRHAAVAVQNGDVSTAGLWQYNLEFNKEYGFKTAGLEVFRCYLQSLNNDVINYGMRNFLTVQETDQLSYGFTPELSLAAKFKMVLKGASNITAFANLVYVVKKMKVLGELYADYPKSPDDRFTEWRHKVEHEMQESKSRFKPSPV